LALSVSNEDFMDVAGVWHSELHIPRIAATALVFLHIPSVPSTPAQHKEEDCQ